MKVNTEIQVSNGGAVHHSGGVKNGNQAHHYAGCGVSPKGIFRATSAEVTCSKCQKMAAANVRDGI